MTADRKKYPHPAELKPEISLPPGAVQEIARWLKVPLRTLYTWLDGREPTPGNRKKLLKRVELPAGNDPDAMKLAFYTAWWNAQYNRETKVEDLL